MNVIISPPCTVDISLPSLLSNKSPPDERTGKRSKLAHARCTLAVVNVSNESAPSATPDKGLNVVQAGRIPTELSIINAGETPAVNQSLKIVQTTAGPVL